MAEHTCHAEGCTTPCPPRHLMCGRHWRMVPPRLQRAVLATFNPRQCSPRSGVRPSRAWHDAANRAIAAIAGQERRPFRRPALLTGDVIDSGVPPPAGAPEPAGG